MCKKSEKKKCAAPVPQRGRVTIVPIATNVEIDRSASINQLARDLRKHENCSHVDEGICSKYFQGKNNGRKVVGDIVAVNFGRRMRQDQALEELPDMEMTPTTIYEIFEVAPHHGKRINGDVVATGCSIIDPNGADRIPMIAERYGSFSLHLHDRGHSWPEDTWFLAFKPEQPSL